MDEFALIRQFFTRPTPGADLGVGDDCALLTPGAGMQTAVSSDMLVEGRHFLAGAAPFALGHKALAVNLSDLAACGARPVAFTLALALPVADAGWLAPFSQGLLTLADAFGCELIGGDTTRGPLNICITVLGEVPRGQTLLRSGARPGDDIWVSGSVGDARLALEARLNQLAVPADLLEAAGLRMDQPQPRVALGMALRGIATAAIDVSDGLAGDLGHVLQHSGVGATLFAATLPGLMAGHRHPWLAGRDVLPWVLAGGDDYELVFTADPAQRTAVQQASAASNTPVTHIGRIEANKGLRLVDANGAPVRATYASFNHFLDGMDYGYPSSNG